MKPAVAARWLVLSWALAGCGLGNPTLVVADDGGAVEDTAADDVGLVEDVGSPVDAGTIDVGGDVPVRDAGGDAGRDVVDGGVVPDVVTPDVGGRDVVTIDTGTVDTGAMDVGTTDVGPRDTGVIDTGVIDTGPRDVGTPDVGTPDVGTPDVGAPDVGTPDVGTPDAGTPDAGLTVVGAPTETCNLSGTAAINGVGRYLMTSTTMGRTNEYQGTCADGTDTNPEVGYLVTLTEHSRLTWTARPTGTPGFVPVVYLTQNCAEQGGDDDRFRDEVACINNGNLPGFAGGGTVDLPPGNYYLVVDGYRSGSSAGSGAYEVVLDVIPWENSNSYSQEQLFSLRCTPVPTSGTAQIMDGDDTVSDIQALGFSFNYFGRALDKLAFSSNGFFMFITTETAPYNTSAWRNHSIAFSGQPRGVVAPFWDDLTINGAADTASLTSPGRARPSTATAGPTCPSRPASSRPPT